MFKINITDARAATNRRHYEIAKRVNAYRMGAPERVTAAEEKRARKAAKRARDAFRSADYAQESRNRLEGKANAEVPHG